MYNAYHFQRAFFYTAMQAGFTLCGNKIYKVS